jgi:hypothetical protein
VTTQVQDALPLDAQMSDAGRWKDQEARRAVKRWAQVDIPLLGEGVSSVTIQDAGIVDLELQRMPQGSNPSWVSRQQFAALAKLPGWPRTPEGRRQIHIGRHGAGFGAPEQNRAVEDAAMAAVASFYDGWDCVDVSRDKVGWDLEFTHPSSGETFKAEVKGVAGTAPRVLLTANEIAAANRHPEWRLAVVTNALIKPTISVYEPAEVLRVATGYVFRADLSVRG